MPEWSIRGLLSPVITRLLIYGVSPIDVEYIVSVLEHADDMRSIEKLWLAEWEKKANAYVAIATPRKRRATISLRASSGFSLLNACTRDSSSIFPTRH
jgi:hypothetical protein